MAGGTGFNKMFVMLPVMFAVRKLDGEDPNIVFYLRCGYFFVQTTIFLLLIWIFLQIRALASQKSSERVVYVPPPPQPFADPNAQKKYTETLYSEHLRNQALSLVSSTVFGACLTTGLHLWKGMVIGLAMQTIMGPLNLVESPLVHAILFGDGIENLPQSKIFEEKTKDELSADDEVVDKEGNTVDLKKIKESSKKSKSGGNKLAAGKKEEEPARSFEEVLLDTWDLGTEADIGPLMTILTKDNINYKTKESEWTPIMIMSAIGVKETKSALRQMKALKADPTVVDEEGWNALHWAAFHGSVDGAMMLFSDYDAVKLGLHEAKDKEGHSPLYLAKSEGNEVVAKIIEDRGKSSVTKA